MLLDGDLLMAALVGRRYVYVGGRPGSNAVLRAWLRAASSSITSR
ncbi:MULTISPECIES: hypothetical protein [Burkholderia]|nr:MULTISPECIES: hypothetical protein [Burkholderia]